MPDALINRDPEILGGTPVFFGTRVPVRVLIDYMEAGDTLDEFLDNHPTVSRDQAVGVLERVKSMLDGRLDETAASRVGSP